MAAREKNRKWWQIPVALFGGDTAAKIFFLVLSVFLWFLIHLNEEGFEGEVNIPIEYRLPDDKKLSNQPDANLRLALRGQGFDLLLLKLRSLKPITLDLREEIPAAKNRYAWSTQSQAARWAEKLPEGLVVEDVAPDTVLFEFHEFQSKKVKVYLNADHQFDATTAFYETPQFSPDSIVLKGTAAELAKVDSVFTQPLKISGEKDTVFKNLKLQLPESDLLVTQTQAVDVSLRFTQLTEGQVEIPVEVLNVPDGFKILLFPKTINVRYQVPLKDYNQIKASQFEAYVDFSGVEKVQGARFLAVKLSSFPAIVRKTSVQPPQLEFILTEE